MSKKTCLKSNADINTFALNVQMIALVINLIDRDLKS